MEGLPHFPALMKTTKISLLLALWTSGGVTASFAQMEGEYQIQPIYSRYAERVKKVTFNATGRIFNDVQLQEADKFDGYTVDADLTIPIPGTERFQIRLYWPIYTDGQARLIDPTAPDFGKKIDIYGYGGTFDYPSITFEYQFLKESDHDFNLSGYLGAGARVYYLKTSTVGKDVYNHMGKQVLFGTKADWRAGDDWRFVANLGGSYYIESDDLNPEGTGSSDVFALANISVSAIYHPWKLPVFPVAELLYQGNFSGYNAIQAVPEVIWAINSHFELKAGLPIGLTSDGQSWGGTFQGTVRF